MGGKSKDNPEKSKELISEQGMKDLLTKQLEIVGSGGAFVWYVSLYSRWDWEVKVMLTWLLDLLSNKCKGQTT